MNLLFFFKREKKAQGQKKGGNEYEKKIDQSRHDESSLYSCKSQHLTFFVIKRERRLKKIKSKNIKKKYTLNKYISDDQKTCICPSVSIKI